MVSVDEAVSNAEAAAISIGAAHLVSELGKPRTDRDAWLLGLVTVSAAAQVVASHIADAAVDKTYRDKLTQAWSDEFLRRIERTLSSRDEDSAGQRTRDQEMHALAG